jgi:fructoselysine-6-P-deglycase FrlB-like protein
MNVTGTFWTGSGLAVAFTSDYFQGLMSAIEHEITDQPRCWELAARVAADNSAVLPPSGRRVCAVGCGTSYYVAQAYAALREQAGHGETDAYPASEMPLDRRYDHLVAITRSGTTSEVLNLIPRVAPATSVLALTGAAGSPVTGLAGQSLVLDFADEVSFVQTRFATSVLALLRAQLGQDIGALAGQARAAVADELPVDPTKFEHFVFIGTGPGAALASEAALKMRETGGAWTEAYAAMELRHGPMSTLGPRSLVWSLGAAPRGLGGEVAGTGATWLESAEDPLVALVRVQQVAVRNSLAQGLDPDHPRFLARSVILADPPDSTRGDDK